MTIGFWLAALLLCALAALFLVLPVRRREDEASADRTHFNVELFEDRLAELEASLADGEITQAEFETLKAELQKNLVTETGEESAPTSSRQRSRLPLVVAVLVPLLAVGMYLWRGALSDVRLADDLQRVDMENPEEVRDTIARLAGRMERQPENDRGWFLLANSYLTLQHYDEAASAFEHLLERYPGDGNLAARYAESLFLAADRTMTPDVRDAVDRALELDPQSLPMLELLGMNAFRRGELGAALGYFRRALATEGARGERAQLIEGAIGAVEAAMEERGETPPTSAPGAEPAPQRVINVRVAAADSVDMPADAAVFVFARAASGPPMPLAVSRMRFRDLPADVRLDETMAMMEGVGLGNFDTVEIIARITRSGGVTASEGDYEARSDVVDLTTDVPRIELVVQNEVGSD